MTTATLELASYRTAFVSDEHLTPADAAVLQEFAGSEANPPFLLVRGDAAKGFDVSTDLDDDASGSKDAALAERMSEPFMTIFREAVDQGFAFVRFDSEGPSVSL